MIKSAVGAMARPFMKRENSGAALTLEKVRADAESVATRGEADPPTAAEKSMEFSGSHRNYLPINFSRSPSFF